MNVSVERIKELRGESGAGVMECRNALVESGGDIEKALDILKQRSLIKAEKTVTRVASQGVVEAYVHTGGRIGALIEVNCETDFVARTGEFKELVHNLAMQVAAMCPKYVSAEQVPAGSGEDPELVSLLLQPYIKDQSVKVKDVINQVIARTGEKIQVKRFARFELGAD
ncbi:MAG: elongation factor Ts [Chloroflexi bacterium]|nr:elongation factor Ts [Chloroflexota bacterium]